MKDKIVSVETAVSHIKDNDTLLIGGFLACGTSEMMMDAIVEKGIRNLTIVANDTGFPDRGNGKLVSAKLVKHAITTHIGTNKETGRQMTEGEMEVTLVPQGSLVEIIRAGGMGLGGVLTPTGVGTEVAEGKQTLEIEGREFLLEMPVKGDVAILKGDIVDKAGNVYYDGTTKNFQEVMALAADTVIVEAKKLVEIGELNPNMVYTPGILVDYILVGGEE